MQQLFRQFGALATGSTPCGKPLSMAHAHALMVMLTKGELSQRELANQLCIDKSNVARLCAKMVEAGHAVQMADDQDRRSRRVQLTSEGTCLAREVDAASRSRFTSLLKQLPAERRRQVLEALDHLVSVLNAPRNSNGKKVATT